MQDVNNDMDDLFRKAAEHYPLKTEGTSDWDKVLAGLEDAGAPAAVVFDNKKKRKKRALWLLLLLPLALLYTTYHYHAATGNKNETTAKQTEQNKTAGNSKTNDTKTGGTKQQENTILPKNKNEEAINKANENEPFSVNNKNKNSSETNRKEVNVNNNAEENTSLYSLRSADKTSSKKEAQRNEENTIAGNKINNQQAKNSNDENALDNNKNNTSAKQPTESFTRIQNITTTDSKTAIAAKQNSAATDSASTGKADSAVAKADVGKDKKEKKEKAKTQRQQGFYAGLEGSFDISTIKLQRINKAGYSLNVLAGYRFSKRLSVESGISLSKKNYYSDGKYFDKGKTGIPDRVKIYFTDGNCNMFEIPVNVKYDFALHKKSNLFVTAGLSSYIMKKESYFYRGNYNMMRVYDTTRSYRNSGSNWLSVANFSIGYQAEINKYSALRIEPYLKVPLRGIGIANMPIISTGILIGFTRKF